MPHMRRVDDLEPGNIIQIKNLTGATATVDGIEATEGHAWYIVTKVDKVDKGIVVPIYAISIQDSTIRLFANGDSEYAVGNRKAKLVKVGHFSRWVP